MAVPKYFPIDEGDTGPHVEGYGRTMARSGLKALQLSAFNALPKKTRQTWGWWHKKAANRIKKKEKWEQDGEWDKKLFHRLMDDGAFDAKATVLVNSYKPPVPPKIPDLGPMTKGGASVLKKKLTHNTGGIPLYPAFDDAFNSQGGIEVIAPESLTVTRASSSNPGDAFYATGKSGFRYWFGHLAVAPSVGKKFSKGQVMGKTLKHNIGGGPHVHVGLNVELLWGAGEQMKCGSKGNGYIPYTSWKQTVEEQLATHK